MPFGVRHTQPEDCIWRTSADIIIGSEMLRFAIFFFVYYLSPELLSRPPQDIKWLAKT